MKKSRPIKRAEAGVPTGKTKPSKQLGRFNRNLHKESSGRRRQTFAALRQSCDIFSKGLESSPSYNIFLGLLDAYTEVPGTKEGMSDSEKFKEGYKKKGKGKVKNPPKKVEEAAEEVEEVEDDGVGESWDDDVVESWDQIDVEEMPVPVKVKKEMRKEEKKRKKDLEKAAKAQDAASWKTNKFPG